AHAHRGAAARGREVELGPADGDRPPDLRGREVAMRLLNLFGRRRRRLEQDLDRELRYHVDRRVRELTDGGLDESDARRRAGLELGGVSRVQEDVRETWTWRWLDDLGRDTRYALRSLSRSWGFALGAGGVLALGTGATIAVFSVVQTVLLRS